MNQFYFNIVLIYAYVFEPIFRLLIIRLKFCMHFWSPHSCYTFWPYFPWFAHSIILCGSRQTHYEAPHRILSFSCLIFYLRSKYSPQIPGTVGLFYSTRPAMGPIQPGIGRFFYRRSSDWGMNLNAHLLSVPPNAWSYTSTSPHVCMTWCLVNHCGRHFYLCETWRSEGGEYEDCSLLGCCVV